MLSKNKVKYIQTLGHKKFRDEEKLFIAEGPKLVHELLLNCEQQIVELYALPEWIDANRQLPGSDKFIEITSIELSKISQLNTPNLVLAVLKYFPAAETIRTAGSVVLALDGIQDPGNLGTIIRVADWFGIKQIVCSRDSADCYNPKVIQATMGSIARVDVFYMDLKEWLPQAKAVKKYIAALTGHPVNEMKKIREGIVIIGNESKGVSDAIMKLADEKITILRIGDAESLNAAVATGIILSHLV
jgi:RNA methyltransferase, TrmH family